MCRTSMFRYMLVKSCCKASFSDWMFFKSMKLDIVNHKPISLSFIDQKGGLFTSPYKKTSRASITAELLSTLQIWWKSM